MPKWEYLFVEVNMVNELSDTFLNNWLVHRINGVEIKDWKKGVHFYTYFNQLGEQGWELFMREQTLYIFKRQKTKPIEDLEEGAAIAASSDYEPS